MNVILVFFLTFASLSTSLQHNGKFSSFLCAIYSFIAAPFPVTIKIFFSDLLI
jgi:hypothetical protein